MTSGEEDERRNEGALDVWVLKTSVKLGQGKASK